MNQIMVSLPILRSNNFKVVHKFTSSFKAPFVLNYEITFPPSAIATSPILYDIPLGRVLFVCHILFSKQTHTILQSYYYCNLFLYNYAIIQPAATLLAKTKSYFRTICNYIMIESFLTNQKSGLTALKIRSAT